MQNDDQDKFEVSTLETIDTGFYTHIKDVFDIHVKSNRGFEKVPVLWQSAERTFQIKNDRTFRDSVGKIKLPIITIERASIIKDKSFKGAVQADLPVKAQSGREYAARPFIVRSRIVQDKTRNHSSARSNEITKGDHHYPDDLKTISSRKIVYETIKVPLPTYVTINYSVVLRTEYQQQMNTMLTPFISTTGQVNHFVFTHNKHRYEAFIEQDYTQSNNSSNLGEDERSFMTKVNIKVLGYIMGDGKNDPKPEMTTEENIVEVKMSREKAALEDEIPWLKKNKKYRSL